MLDLVWQRPATILAGVAVGLLLQRSFSESLFVSVVVALSSTTVVVNSLSAGEQDSSYGRGLLGVLLMQDVYLGAIVATTSLVGSYGEVTFVDCITLSGRLIGSLLLVGVFAVVITKYFLAKMVQELASKDMSVRMLGLLAACFAVMSLTDIMGVSNELGCFVAGLMISGSQVGRVASFFTAAPRFGPVLAWPPPCRVSRGPSCLVLGWRCA